MLMKSNVVVHSAQGVACVNKDSVDLKVEIRSVETCWEFCVLDSLTTHCIVGKDYMKDRRISLDLFKKSLIVNTDENVSKKKSVTVSIDLGESGLSKVEKEAFNKFLVGFGEVFSAKPGLTHVAWHGIDTGLSAPVFSKPYLYDKVKQGIIDYHIQKMLADDIKILHV